MKEIRANKNKVERAISSALRRAFTGSNVDESRIGDALAPRWQEFLVVNKKGRRHGCTMVHVVINEFSDVSKLSLGEQRMKYRRFYEANTRISKAICAEVNRTKDGEAGDDEN